MTCRSCLRRSMYHASGIVFIPDSETRPTCRNQYWLSYVSESCWRRVVKEGARGEAGSAALGEFAWLERFSIAWMTSLVQCGGTRRTPLFPPFARGEKRRDVADFPPLAKGGWLRRDQVVLPGRR